MLKYDRNSWFFIDILKALFHRRHSFYLPELKVKIWNAVKTTVIPNSSHCCKRVDKLHTGHANYDFVEYMGYCFVDGIFKKTCRMHRYSFSCMRQLVKNYFPAIVLHQKVIEINNSVFVFTSVERITETWWSKEVILFCSTHFV